MVKRGNPPPFLVIDDRPLKTFHRKVQVRLNGSLHASEPTKQWQSNGMDVHGFTRAEGFVCVEILHDSQPDSPFALLGRLIQFGGGGGAPGPQSAISFGIPGIPGKAYLGTGTYAFDLLQAGSARSKVGLSNVVQFQLWALGRPRGRVLRVVVDGTMTAGWTY